MFKLPLQLEEEIRQYCLVNNIDNIEEFIISLLKRGFTIEKYGITPTLKNKDNTNKPIEDKKEEVIIENDLPEKEIDKNIEIKTNKNIYGE